MILLNLLCDAYISFSNLSYYVIVKETLSKKMLNTSDCVVPLFLSQFQYFFNKLGHNKPFEGSYLAIVREKNWCSLDVFTDLPQGLCFDGKSDLTSAGRLLLEIQNLCVA